jgi:hypothetical protein
MEIKRCKATDYLEEVLELSKEHWKEVEGMAGCPELKLDLDVILHHQLERAGVLVALGLFDEGRLIGYLQASVGPSFQHRGVLFAQTEGLYVKPSKRGIRSFRKVQQMFRIMEAILKEEYGVKYFSMRSNTSNDLRVLAESLDYTADSIEYIKRL